MVRTAFCGSIFSHMGDCFEEISGRFDWSKTHGVTFLTSTLGGELARRFGDISGAF